MGEHRVCRADEVPVDRGLIVRVRGRELGIFRHGDEFFALRNLCPHQRGPAAEGGVFKRLCARHSPGKVEEYYDEENPVVACPWHGWEFDLKTGVCLADPERRLGRYEAVLRDGEVAVVLPD
jgi:nitrite reductase/ring-hydroxylating ferredoxin subunit